MRRKTLLVGLLATTAALGAGAATADVTDVLAVPSLTGALTVTGAGVGTTAAPATLSSQTVGTTSGAFPGSQLTVTDDTGTTAGWDVTATYSPLTTTQQNALVKPAGVVSTGDIGAANVRVTASTTGPLAASNATTGVANPVLASSASLASPVRVSRSNGDGRGTTVFDTSYTVALPAKTAMAATLYTGKIVYTVAPAAP